MWVAQHNNADLILREALKTQNQHQVGAFFNRVTVGAPVAQFFDDAHLAPPARSSLRSVSHSGLLAIVLRLWVTIPAR